MQRQFLQFLLRWVLNAFGIWIAARLLAGHGIDYDIDRGWPLFIWAGLALSLVNVFLKPLVTILSLPAILLTFGLFTLIVNGLMVFIAAHFVSGLDVSFGAAILTGMIVGLVNYVLTNLLDITQKGNN